MSKLLDVRDLNVSLAQRDGPISIVRGIDFTIAPGEIVGIAGESGSGKSVSVLSLMGLAPGTMRTTGTASLGSTQLIGAPLSALQSVRGREVGIVFQDSLASMHPMLTIETLLTEGLYRHFKLSRPAARERAVELLHRVRIPDPVRALRRYPHQFSGGMRQRIAIAVALACEPRLLIADEPTTALDVTVQAGILRLFDDLRRDISLSVLLITHDLGVMSAITDRLYVFYCGRVVESGPTKELIAWPRHPYTRALLDAIPHSRAARSSASGIPGEPPHPGHWPSGCVFHPRCAFAQDACRAEEPALAPISVSRRLRCFVDPFGGNGR
jgi:oligopeptide/dipeptide ABC transporter ATP-binding protein